MVGESTWPVAFEMTLTSVIPTVVVAVRLNVETVVPPGATRAVANCAVVGTTIVGVVYRVLQSRAEKARAMAAASGTKKREKRRTAFSLAIMLVRGF